MKKQILFFLCSIFLLSCSDINQTENLLGEIEILREQNDSLKNIVTEISQKYIFDSLTVRDIKYEGNTYKTNSIFKTKIVFVGYNVNGKSSVVIGDSISYEDGSHIYNGDSLELKKGEFLLEKKLTSGRNQIWGILKTENQYGQPFESNWTTVIKVE